MRFASKTQFLDRIRAEWERLWQLLDQADPDALATRVVWGVDRTVKDALMHVHEWHRMNLRWYRDGLTGTPEMPAKGYTWLECPKLNQAIFEQHRSLPLAEAKRRLRKSHAETLALLETLSEAALLTPGQPGFTGTPGYSFVTAYAKVPKVEGATSYSCRIYNFYDPAYYGHGTTFGDGIVRGREDRGSEYWIGLTGGQTRDENIGESVADTASRFVGIIVEVTVTY